MALGADELNLIRIDCEENEPNYLFYRYRKKLKKGYLADNCVMPPFAIL